MDFLAELLEKLKAQSHNINVIAGVLRIDPTIIHNTIDTAIKDVKIIDAKIDELIEELRPPKPSV